jgi:phytol kinase
MNYSLLRDSVATLIALLVALSWLVSVNQLAVRGVIQRTLSRKIVHVGTGPLFLLCWNLFSPEPTARFFAALVPGILTLTFFAVGIDWIKNPDLVQSVTRQGKPQELLKGPLYYGIAFIVCTLIFWRHSPVGILALMIMCGGDGLADIVGRRWGHHKLPINSDKSWAGSAAMFMGSVGFGLTYLIGFNALGNFQPPLELWETTGLIIGIAGVATVVEALPVQDIDNILLTIVGIGLGYLFL